MVLKDGVKMSKFKGNVVSFKEIFKKYGVDVVRFFIFFVVLLVKELEWNDSVLEGVYWFIKCLYDKVNVINFIIFKFEFKEVSLNEV